MFHSKLLDSRTQIVVQSDSLAARPVAVKLPLPEVLSALAAEIALVLDELSAKLKVCEMFEANAADCRKERPFLYHSSTPRVSLRLQEMLHLQSLGQVSCRAFVPPHCLELCVLASFAC